MTAFPAKPLILRLLGASALTLAAGTASADFVINDDLIVDGSACIGFDCVNGEVFGFDTLRLKENNTRLQFNDTSVAASFPTNNWQIRANSSTNGGQSYLAFIDQGASGTSQDGTLVFAVEANARANSLYVDDGGRIGSRTSTPSVEIHTIDGDTPTLRLQQDGSSGFEPQTWDVAGNETNFFVRDVTNGSTLPLRIRPSAPSSSIFIDQDGDVGMGTSSPHAPLHILAAGAAAAQNAGDDLIIQDDGPARFALVNTASAGNEVWTFNSNDTLRVSAGADASEFTLDEDGNLTILGTLTENSNRNAKTAITPVDTREILDKVAALEVSAWTYKHDAEDGIRHIGPMAQDFHAAFGLGAGPTGISTMDTSGVALAAIRALVEENRTLSARVDALEADLR